MLILIAVKGPDRGTVFELSQDQRHLIGRQSKTIRMRDRKLSRRHADVYFQDGQWVIDDAGSTNGTRVNSRRIEGCVALTDGDRVQLGRTVFVVGELQPGAQPMRATQTPELDPAEQLHDSEADFRFEEEDSDAAMDAERALELRDTIVAARRSAAPLPESEAAGSSRSSRSSSRRSHSSTSRGRFRTADSQDTAGESQSRRGKEPIHPKFAAVPDRATARAFWVVAAGILILIGLNTALHLRVSHQQRTGGSNTAQVDEIRNLLQSHSQSQTDSLDALRGALASLPGTVDSELADRILDELRTLPHATGEQLIRDVLAAIELHAQRQQDMLAEVRGKLDERMPDNDLLTQLRTELHDRPGQAAAAAAQDAAQLVIDALNARSREQTEALLAAINEQPAPAERDMVEQVLAELRAQPRVDQQSLTRELTASLQQTANEQTAELVQQMRRAIDDQPRASDREVRQLIAELRRQPHPRIRDLTREVVAAVQEESTRQQEAFMRDIRAALSEPRGDVEAIQQALAQLGERAEPAGEELREAIITAMQVQSQADREALVATMVRHRPDLDADVLSRKLAEAMSEVYAQHNPDALAEQVAASLQTHQREQNEAVLSRIAETLTIQPNLATPEAIEQALAAVQSQSQQHSQAVLAEVRAQLQLENQALLEELLTALHTGQGGERLADAGGSLLSHMRPMPRPGPMTIERQRALQQQQSQQAERPVVAAVPEPPAQPRQASRTAPAQRSTNRRANTSQPSTAAVAVTGNEEPAIASVLTGELFLPSDGDEPIVYDTPHGDLPRLEVGKEVRTESGLRFIVNRQGEGAIAERGDTILVHYTGYLEDGTKFDCSRERNQPFGFELGNGSVIKGWEEGVEGMYEGERRTLHIPADLAYGNRGAGRNIPPQSNLRFEMEVITVLKR